MCHIVTFVVVTVAWHGNTIETYNFQTQTDTQADSRKVSVTQLANIMCTLILK